MHFKHIITVSSQRLHILKTLKRQGLRLELLYCVFHAIILNKIMYAISAWYGFLNKSHVLQINSLFSVPSNMHMSNEFISSSSFYKIMMTTCSPKQPMKTMPCIICFPVPSPFVITYEVLDMACRSVLSDLNSIKRHLLIELYLVSVTDIFVCAYTA